MTGIPTGLIDLLDPERRLAVMGIGNPLIEHDVFGPSLADALAEVAPPSWLVLNCETVPENFLGKVRSFGPDLVLFVDTFVDDGSHGELLFCNAREVEDVGYGTHKLSLGQLVSFLSSSMACEFWFLGLNAGLVGGGRQLEIAQNIVSIIQRDRY